MWVLDDTLDSFEHFAGPIVEANQVHLLKHIDPVLVYLDFKFSAEKGTIIEILRA